MKKYIIILLMIIPGICVAQKENQLEFSFTYGKGYNYGVTLAPFSYNYRGLSGYSKKTYYGISEDGKNSSQLGFMFYPKYFRIGQFALGFGFQYLELRSTVTCDSLVSESGYFFPPYSNSYAKKVNLSWDVSQSMVQVPIFVRYQSASNGGNGIYADVGILPSLYRRGVYPEGIVDNAEFDGQVFRAYSLGAGYQYKIQREIVSIYLNIGATYQRTWTASVLGQKYGFLGARVSLALGWEALPE